MRLHPQLILFCLALVAATTAHAAPALVRLVIGSASAKANTRLPHGSNLSTAKKSRTEVSLSSGIVRTGSDTSVQITSDDSLRLAKGIALVATKPRFFRSSINISTPECAAKVRGTAQIYYDPGHSIRIVALEGNVTVALSSVRGESITLKRGQELILNPTDKQLPTPVEVDLNRLMATMALLDRATFPALPSTTALDSSAEFQEQELTDGEELDATDLIMESAGPGVNLLTEELIHDDLDEEIDDLDADGDPDDGTTLFDEDGNPIDPDLDGDGDPATSEDGTTENPDQGADNFIDEGTGDDSGDGDPDRSATRNGGKGSTKGSKQRGVNINARTISANSVRLGAITKRANIQITNSTQVAALAGTLKALGQGGNIRIDSSSLKAATDIILDTSGTAPGFIQLTNATLNANVIKARAFATGGDALIIDGSTLDAAQLISLYAEGTSTLRFRNQVNLNTPQAILSGQTVEVDAGGNVKVTGRADIYTDNAHYNQAGYGNISAGGGVTTQPHAHRPGF